VPEPKTTGTTLEELNTATFAVEEAGEPYFNLFHRKGWMLAPTTNDQGQPLWRYWTFEVLNCNCKLWDRLPFGVSCILNPDFIVARSWAPAAQVNQAEGAASWAIIQQVSSEEGVTCGSCGKRTSLNLRS
jgi:hypothetical protein